MLKGRGRGWLEAGVSTGNDGMLYGKRGRHGDPSAVANCCAMVDGREVICALHAAVR